MNICPLSEHSEEEPNLLYTLMYGLNVYWLIYM